MAPTFSLAHLTALNCAPPELTYIAARAGYDFVSPRIIMTGTPNEIGYNYDLSQDPAMLRETRQALAETGMKVHDIELVRITDTFYPESLIPIFDVAAELGVHHVLSSIWTPNRELATERFADLCDVARPYDLNISLEFVTWANVVNLRGAHEIVRAVDRSNARLAIDLLHVHRSRVTLEELAAVPSHLYSFVHLCDGPDEIPTATEALIHTGRAARLYPGEGSIDILGMLGMLPPIPYSIEVPHLARAKQIGNAEHAARCLQKAKAFFALNAFTGPARSPSRTVAAVS